MPGSRLEQPFLRAPRFPNVRPATASITSGRLSLTRPVTKETLDRLVRARVGGDFWGATVPIQQAVLVRTAGVTSDADGVPLPDDCDPWSALAQTSKFISDDDDDWTIVAGLLGIDVLVHTGQGRSPDTLLALAQESIGGWDYRNPFDGNSATIDASIALLSLWRQTFEANQRIVAVAGIRRWKRAAVDSFFFDGGRHARVVPMTKAIALAKAELGAAIAYWPSRVEEAEVGQAIAAGVPLVSIEDGFVRSSGLGSNLTPPASIVVDSRGIHYDPSTPSDLEHLLQTGAFDTDLLGRARALIARLTSDAIGKYGRQASVVPPVVGHASAYVIVIGQVDDDQSVQRGRSETVGGNRDLLRAVRAEVGDTEIVYRPHPDVDAGHRDGGLSDGEAFMLANRIERGGNLYAAMADAAEVHVLTSLAGFEALIRGYRVVVHGRPFYAGWGLTDDRVGHFARRTRRLSIAELVAGALIRYPRSLDPVTHLPCSVETVVDRLVQGASPTTLSRLRQAQGRVRARLAHATVR